jgi:GNAT superfamily N-acetyltransferase
MRVRVARPADRVAVDRLYFRLNPGRRRDGPLPSLRVSVRSRILLAEEGGRPVGFAWANLVRYAGTSVGYIEELFVLPGHRRHGAGTLLLREALAWFQSQRPPVVFVSTSAGDRRAWRFYESLGFRRTRGPWFFWAPRR